VAIAALTAQLPSLAGALPGLFRRNDGTAVRADDAGSTTAKGDPSTRDEQRALSAHSTDDSTRMLARRAALGPLTYGRRALSSDAPAAAPVGMRGAHLDVRG
jgi:hypothetical protein